MVSPQILVCANAPNPELALANSVHVNPEDARTSYVNISNFVYRAVPHPDVAKGRIAMNAVQRRMAKTFAGNPVEVWEFMVPMSRDFSIGAVTIEAQFLKRSSNRIADLTSLANAVRSALMGDVLTFGQSIVIKYLDDNILLWVKSNVRGIVTVQTEICIDWRDDNM